MDTPQWFALGAVGTGLVSLALQIAVLFVDRDGRGSLFVRVAHGSAAVAVALSVLVLFL